MAKIAALILAAGHSSRMGRFKPLLPLGHKTAMAWAAGAFADAGIDRLAVVTGHEAAALETVLADAGIPAVRNPDYASGMFSSIRAGIASLDADVDACFLLPVDIPLVRPSTVAALAARHAQSPMPVIHPTFGGRRGHPPLIGRELFAAIRAGDGEGGLRALLEQYPAAEVAVADEAILLDMDVPEDHAELDLLARHRHLPSAAECEALLELAGVAEPVRRHSRAVAAVAQALAHPLEDLDRQLIIAGGLLHDIAKGRPDHAEAGARRLYDLGFPQVAEVVRRHMDLDFADGGLDEATLVYLADKLVREDRRVSLMDRFRPAFVRFSDQPEALAGARRRYDAACHVLAAIEGRAGKSGDELLHGCGVPA